MHFLDFYDIMVENIEKELSAVMNNKEKWAVPIYTKAQIERAGKTLARPYLPSEEKKEALNVLNNWRASHAYPLQVIASNLRRNNPNAIVVQRLKRLDSIVHKLERFSEMSLYRMQDLGGCRVIVDSIEDVYAALNQYKNSNIRHILVKENNYIDEPQKTGYRSIHAIYKFYSDKKETYNKNMLIEIQFRTRLQHSWATAVETMGLYTNSALKSNMGNPEILRFFALVSSVFAMQENTNIVPNTSTDYNELIYEIRKINENSNILTSLKALSQVMDHTRGDTIRNGYYILILNYNKMTLNIKSFSQSQIEIATTVYNQIEERQEPNIDVVLVAASSLNTLRDAYPNYFSDISDFISRILQILTQ